MDEMDLISWMRRRREERLHAVLKERGESEEEIKNIITTILDGPIVTTPQIRILENGEAKDLLTSLYSEIWTQACYDPDTKEIGEFCGRRLLPLIKKLNEILKFRE